MSKRDPQPAGQFREGDTFLLDSSRREVEPHIGAIGTSIARVKGVNAKERTVEALVSTPNIDRYEEAVEPQAFRELLPTFMSNPVLIAGHTYVGMSGEATVIGHWLDVRITREGLLARAKFAGTALAEEYWQLYRDGHMKAFSVGWITRAFEMRDTKLPDGSTKRIRWFTQVELIEISAVAIPANRESLVRAASAAPGRREQKGERLGRRIRAAREEKEMTLEQVAAELPITASTLASIEDGTIIRPPDEVLRAIASALDLPFRELQQLADQDQQDQGARQDDDTGGDTGGERGMMAYRSVFDVTVKGERLGARLRARREELGLSLEQVAAQLPITASTLGQIEGGTIVRPPDEVLEALAEALDLPLRELQELADADAGADGDGDGGDATGSRALRHALRSLLDDDDDAPGCGASRAESNRAAAQRLGLSNRQWQSACRAMRPVVRQCLRDILSDVDEFSDNPLYDLIQATAEATALSMRPGCGADDPFLREVYGEGGDGDGIDDDDLPDDHELAGALFDILARDPDARSD